MTISSEQFEARQRHVGLSGLGPLELDIAYTDIGEGDPIVLRHGIPTLLTVCRHNPPIVPELPRARPRPSRPRRGGPTGPVRPVAASASRCRVRLLDVLGDEPATFVGHDTAGGIVLILVSNIPIG